MQIKHGTECNAAQVYNFEKIVFLTYETTLSIHLKNSFSVSYVKVTLNDRVILR